MNNPTAQQLGLFDHFTLTPVDRVEAKAYRLTSSRHDTLVGFVWLATWFDDNWQAFFTAWRITHFDPNSNEHTTQDQFFLEHSQAVKHLAHSYVSDGRGVA